MKIVVPLYGLGNVMFQYAFLCELRKRSNEACCFFVYREKLFDHNGYELNKLFKVEPYKGLNLLQRAYIHTLEWLGKLNLPNFFLLRPFFKVIRMKGEDSFVYYPEVFNYPHQNVVFWGMWQSPNYFVHARQEIIDTFRFDLQMISPYTRNVLDEITHTPSVSIHLRRGDYLAGPHKEGFASCCSADYYRRAMAYIQERVESPVYFVFSDDIAFAKANLKAARIHFVDGNHRADSWQDMFLMSRCRHNIVANSTFSWWGAFLNGNPDKTVIAPKRWWSFLETDDVVPDEWVRL
ncbi:MAG: alpha-1,2-fucosyltransferase [Prevotellaceae bacterium]|jgi:hypothetical protein|nr:alpha-1,2-fucosyltransferase [Prevotellaceae bacterium]